MNNRFAGISRFDTFEVVEKMNAKYGGIYSAGVIPAKTYPGQDKDNKISVVQNILVADAKLPEKTVYDIVKTLYERRDEIARMIGGARLTEKSRAHADELLTHAQGSPMTRTRSKSGVMSADVR